MFREKLKQGLTAVGLDAERADLGRYETFYRLVIEWNKRHNLTRIEAEDDFIEKHLLDSLLVVPYLRKAATVLDIGSGAGFPGIPLALYDDGLHVTLIESRQKKAAFLQAAIEALRLHNASVHSVYLTKTTILQIPHSKSPVTCISRATLPASELVELTLPVLKQHQGARLIAMQGPKSGGQAILTIDKALAVLAKRHALAVTVHGPLFLPKSRAERFFVEIAKTG